MEATGGTALITSRWANSRHMLASTVEPDSFFSVFIVWAQPLWANPVLPRTQIENLLFYLCIACNCQHHQCRTLSIAGCFTQSDISSRDSIRGRRVCKATRRDQCYAPLRSSLLYSSTHYRALVLVVIRSTSAIYRLWKYVRNCRAAHYAIYCTFIA